MLIKTKLSLLVKNSKILLFFVCFLAIVLLGGFYGFSLINSQTETVIEQQNKDQINGDLIFNSKDKFFVFFENKNIFATKSLEKWTINLGKVTISDKINYGSYSDIFGIKLPSNKIIQISVYKDNQGPTADSKIPEVAEDGELSFDLKLKNKEKVEINNRDIILYQEGKDNNSCQKSEDSITFNCKIKVEEQNVHIKLFDQNNNEATLVEKTIKKVEKLDLKCDEGLFSNSGKLECTCNRKVSGKLTLNNQVFEFKDTTKISQQLDPKTISEGNIKIEYNDENQLIKKYEQILQIDTSPLDIVFTSKMDLNAQPIYNNLNYINPNKDVIMEAYRTNYTFDLNKKIKVSQDPEVRAKEFLTNDFPAGITSLSQVSQGVQYGCHDQCPAIDYRFVFYNKNNRSQKVEYVCGSGLNKVFNQQNCKKM
ncbi:MAG: hypothetical protein ACRCXZ_08365 [Patescibacteria group bacterium]